MELNTIKCRQIVITNKRKSSSFVYHLHGKAVPQTLSHDYLGVTITHDSRWNAHCANIANKSNKVLGIIRRTRKPCSKPVKKRAYETLVRPKVEYASEAWNKHTNQDVNKIEQVQKNTARFVCNNCDRSMSSSDLVSTLNWDTLEIRRLAQQASMFYKIRNGFVGITFPSVVIPNPRHSGMHCKPQCNVLNFSYSFYIRTIRVWNRLPEQIINAQSLKTFNNSVYPAMYSMTPPLYLKSL